jgi:hypothetical protein
LGTVTEVMIASWNVVVDSALWLKSADVNVPLFVR